MFQFTLPRGERLPRRGKLDPVLCVSIHAPAWGATVFPTTKHHLSSVSIHAPAWGATLPDCRYWVVIDVSIHAPAWGATCQR